MPVATNLPMGHEAEVEDLMKRLEDLAPLPASHEMARWVVATQHRVEEAEEMYRKSAEWRRQKGVDRILKWNAPEVLRKYYPGGFAGFDREGCPVWIIPFGHADVKGMLACASKEEFMDFTLKIVECSMLLMRKKCHQLGKPVNQHVFIFDLDGFSLKAATHSPTLDILQKLIAVYEANYPETLKAAYVLNASSFFQLVFRIVQSAVQQKTLGKIQVFGTDDWKEPLLAAMPADILPAQWGGTSNQGGKKGSICMGGEVTSQEKREHKPEEIPGMGDILTVEIAPGSEVILKYTVSQDCQVRWKFKSEGGDLAFGVKKKKAVKTKDGGGFMEASETSAVDVVMLKRVDSNKDLQTGVLNGKAGFTYLLSFDNSFSRFKAKTLMYGVLMEESEESDSKLIGGALSIESLLKSVRVCMNDKGNEMPRHLVRKSVQYN